MILFPSVPLKRQHRSRPLHQHRLKSKGLQWEVLLQATTQQQREQVVVAMSHAD
jgi:hypothetical protein